MEEGETAETALDVDLLSPAREKALEESAEKRAALEAEAGKFDKIVKETFAESTVPFGLDALWLLENKVPLLATGSSGTAPYNEMVPPRLVDAIEDDQVVLGRADEVSVISNAQSHEDLVEVRNYEEDELDQAFGDAMEDNPEDVDDDEDELGEENEEEQEDENDNEDEEESDNEDDLDGGEDALSDTLIEESQLRQEQAARLRGLLGIEPVGETEEPAASDEAYELGERLNSTELRELNDVYDSVVPLDFNFVLPSQQVSVYLTVRLQLRPTQRTPTITSPWPTSTPRWNCT